MARRREKTGVGVGVEGLKRGSGDEEVRIVIVGEDVMHSRVVMRGRAGAAVAAARTCRG